MSPLLVAIALLLFLVAILVIHRAETDRWRAAGSGAFVGIALMWLAAAPFTERPAPAAEWATVTEAGPVRWSDLDAVNANVVHLTSVVDSLEQQGCGGP